MTLEQTGTIAILLVVMLLVITKLIITILEKQDD